MFQDLIAERKRLKMCSAILCYVLLFSAMLCLSLLCSAILCYARLCFAILCYVLTCHYSNSNLLFADVVEIFRYRQTRKQIDILDKWIIQTDGQTNKYIIPQTNRQINRQLDSRIKQIQYSTDRETDGKYRWTDRKLDNTNKQTDRQTGK